jgi:hypothetical protein
LKKLIVHIVCKTKKFDFCTEFLKVIYKERRETIKKKKFYFSCFSPNHLSKGCSNKLKWGKCEKSHPTAMHINGLKFQPRQPKATELHDEERSKGPESQQSVCTASNTSCDIFHAILLVRVHQNGGQKVIKTYCFYDNGSSGCFITESPATAMLAVKWSAT